MKPALAVTFGSRAVPSFWPVLWPMTMELGDRAPEPVTEAEPSPQQGKARAGRQEEAEDQASAREETADTGTNPAPDVVPGGDERAVVPELPAREARASKKPEAGRPRYLLFALIAALVFGAGCWTEGCARLAFYRGEREHYAAQNQAIADDSDRGQAEQLYQSYIDAADATRGRGVPLAAATFVLGAALLALAARGLAGRSNTRSALMQVVLAQAIVVATTFFTTKDVRRAEDDWQYQAALFQRRDKIPSEQYADVANTLNVLKRWAPPGWLAFRSLASALIILALSRPRSRDFFDAAARPLSER